ncbi:clotting factor G beta subunit-like isoform X1 [Oratosquilla oratoria]|uniref:clotting factor G beta subunit-like isoform X1 n=1 Tax=Oratosquilla oratoria TaxID=337810 RepID=UPI003F76D155
MRQKWNVLLLVVLLGCCGVVLGQGSFLPTNIRPVRPVPFDFTRPVRPVPFDFTRPVRPNLFFPTPPPSSSCTLRGTSVRGTCTLINECTFVVQNIRKVFPTICRFEGRQLYVCCPSGSSSVTDVSPPSVSFTCGTTLQNPITFEFHRRFVESTLARPDFRSAVAKEFGREPDLGPLSPSSVVSRVARRADLSSLPRDFNEIAVVNGIPSIKNSWPWMALLGEENNPRAPWFCDGVLINEQWVLTAAHCITVKVPHVVRLGEHNLSSTHESNHRDYYVKNFVFHPDYDHRHVYHDLALIQLKQRVSITGSIRPVCLPWGRHPLPATGSLLTLTGWGGTYYNGPMSAVLQEASLYLLPASKCVAGYSTLTDYPQKYPRGVTSDLLCIGDTDGQGQDACQGDSGGPVMHRRNNKYYLSGIVSLGYGCGKPEFPGIYASVHHSPDLAWIKRIAF